MIRERAEMKQRDVIIAELLAAKAKIDAAGVDCAAEFGVTRMAEIRAMPFKKFVRIAERIKAQIEEKA